MARRATIARLRPLAEGACWLGSTEGFRRSGGLLSEDGRIRSLRRYGRTGPVCAFTSIVANAADVRHWFMPPRATSLQTIRVCVIGTDLSTGVTKTAGKSDPVELATMEYAGCVAGVQIRSFAVQRG